MNPKLIRFYLIYILSLIVKNPVKVITILIFISSYLYLESDRKNQTYSSVHIENQFFMNGDTSVIYYIIKDTKGEFALRSVDNKAIDIPEKENHLFKMGQTYVGVKGCGVVEVDRIVESSDIMNIILLFLSRYL